MKTKNTFNYILIILIMMFTISCGPSAKEREAAEEARRSTTDQDILKMGDDPGVRYVHIDFGWDSGNGCIPEYDYQYKIIKAISNFKKENPGMRINSFEVRYYGGGSHKMLPDGIWINFEPKETQKAKNYPVWMDNLVEGTVSIPKGGTLCGTLGMTEKEALNFAKANKIKYWYEGKILKVDIQPEDWINFKTKVVKEWKKVKPFYHNRGHS